MTSNKSPFISVPLKFAGKQKKLTIYLPHVMQRWGERMGEKAADAQVSFVVDYMKSLLEDDRLAIIEEKVPVFGKIVLYSEERELYVFLQKGTKKDEDEMKVSTLLPKVGKNRILVDRTDFCYVLPATGVLRFGKEKKYFEYKTK